MSSSAATPVDASTQAAPAAAKRPFYTLYDASVPIAQQALASLKQTLEKAEATPNGEQLFGARLYDDMLPLTFQIFQVADLSIKMAARLMGKDIPLLEDNIASYADAYAQIDKAQEILAEADRDTVNSRQNEIVILELGIGPIIHMEASGYVSSWTIPNLLFHLTVSFSILRSRGVSIGKKDYLSPFLAPYYVL